MRYVTISLTMALCVASSAMMMARAAAAKPAAKTAPAATKYDEAKLKELEAKLAKTPNDAKLKSEAAEAHYQVGHTMMLDDKLPPRTKYPGALKHFDSALKLNPKHAKAAEEKKMIEDIYKQMGRPIPK